MSQLVMHGTNSIKCLVCKKVWTLELPMEVSKLVKEMKDIEKKHKNECAEIQVKDKIKRQKGGQNESENQSKRCER